MKVAQYLVVVFVAAAAASSYSDAEHQAIERQKGEPEKDEVGMAVEIDDEEDFPMEALGDKALEREEETRGRLGNYYNIRDRLARRKRKLARSRCQNDKRPTGCKAWTEDKIKEIEKEMKNLPLWKKNQDIRFALLKRATWKVRWAKILKCIPQVVAAVDQVKVYDDEKEALKTLTPEQGDKDMHREWVYLGGDKILAYCN